MDSEVSARKSDLPDLESRLLAAHSAQDSRALIQLYTEAADARESQGDIDAMCFYLTHAFVFALELGAPERHRLQQRLWEHGREVEPDKHV